MIVTLRHAKDLWKIIMNTQVAFELSKELNYNVSFSRTLRMYVRVVYGMSQRMP